MVKYLSWYLADNRFTDLAKEIEEKVLEYGEAKEKDEAEEKLFQLREKARNLCEYHCCKSGIKNNSRTYINIDAEFFNGKSIDNNALDNFIKEIIKAHCYQKVLWTYIGTTGSFTQITKTDMEQQGLNYKDYLPLPLKEKYEEKSPIEDKIEENAVPFYIYPDGSISQKYDKEKAKFSFNSLDDKSGFNWKKGYDPNDSIIKTDWYGKFNEEDEWIKVKKEKNENSIETDNFPASEIQIVIDNGVTILHDPGNILFDIIEIDYLTKSGELYGKVETDIEATVNKIKETVLSMGIDKIDKVSCNKAAGKKAAINNYKKVLKELASENLTICSIKETEKIIEHEKIKSIEIEKEKNGLKLERVITKIQKRGIESKEEIEKTVYTGKIDIPLSIKNREDAKVLGLTENEIIYISKLNIPPAKEKLFNNALVNIYANWQLYEHNNISKTEIADKVYNIITEEKSDESSIASETLFKDIVIKPINKKDKNNYKPVLINKTAIPGLFNNDKYIDFYNEAERKSYISYLEKNNIVSGETADIILKEFEKLPLAQEAVKEKINYALARTLMQYKHIASSTGMTIKEIIQDAINIIKNPDIEIKSGSRRIFYDLSLSNVIREASKQNSHLKEEALNEAEEAITPVVIIGGAAGTPLDKIFTEEYLAKEYGFSQEEAEETKKFLHSIKIGEGQEDIFTSEILPVIKQHLYSYNKKRSKKNIREEVLKTIDKEGYVSYNLASEEGTLGYIKSGRKGNLTEEDIKTITDNYIKEKGKEKVKDNRKIISAIYKSKPVTEIINVKSDKNWQMKELIARKKANVKEKTGSIYIEDMEAVFYTEEACLDKEKDNLPALLFNDRNDNDRERRLRSVSEYSSLDEYNLVERYGFSRQEAMKAEIFFNTMHIPLGREEYYRREIAQIIINEVKKEHITKNLRQRIIEELSQRDDIAFNLSSPVGKSAFMDSPRYKSSGFRERVLHKYITETIKNSSYDYKKLSVNTPPPPVYCVTAEAAANMGICLHKVKLEEKKEDKVIKEAKKEETIPLATSSVKSEVSLKALHYPAEQVSDSANKDITSSIDNNIDNMRGSISLKDLMDTGEKTETSNNKDKKIDADNKKDKSFNEEELRHKRIEANYEKDKANLIKEKEPALTRSITHDVGHAEEESSNEEDSPEKVADAIYKNISRTLRKL